MSKQNAAEVIRVALNERRQLTAQEAAVLMAFLNTESDSTGDYVIVRLANSVFLFALNYTSPTSFMLSPGTTWGGRRAVLVELNTRTVKSVVVVKSAVSGTFWRQFGFAAERTAYGRRGQEFWVVRSAPSLLGLLLAFISVAGLVTFILFHFL
jgi:hypothetical protein